MEDKAEYQYDKTVKFNLIKFNHITAVAQAKVHNSYTKEGLWQQYINPISRGKSWYLYPGYTTNTYTFYIWSTASAAEKGIISLVSTVADTRMSCIPRVAAHSQKKM